MEIIGPKVLVRATALPLFWIECTAPLHTAHGLHVQAEAEAAGSELAARTQRTMRQAAGRRRTAWPASGDRACLHPTYYLLLIANKMAYLPAPPAARCAVTGGWLLLAAGHWHWAEAEGGAQQPAAPTGHGPRAVHGAWGGEAPRTQGSQGTGFP
jgi:hypothetical protein